MKDSPFYSKEILYENELAFVVADKFPVSKGHCLVIPKRLAKNIFELNEMEVLAIFSLIQKVKQEFDVLYQPDGYNIGTNTGEAAGQTIAHCHFHLIPRYKGDTQNPKGGGVRYVKAIKIKDGLYGDFREKYRENR
ncbi:MAG: HIT family protein [Leptospiraceae bacterium]|nr:HIT family protein [Leptospiraceae bacterium]MCP5501513.1 HIT family protein [Leptospiraceae bacterium]